jgi:predicted DNA-binding transcriptional regulator YafY
VKAQIPIESVTLAARQLLRLGAEVEVLEPAALRSAIAREAESVAALYA